MKDPQPSVGVMFPPRAAVEQLPRFAARVQQLGLDELWVVEDCFLSGGIAMSATALCVTQSVRVGIGLLPAAVRNPAIAAMELSTLARLHPGRVAVAFGHGVAAWMRQIGAHPHNRLAALEEVSAAVRALVAGETVSTEGHSFRLQDVVLETPPPVPPLILIGTTGPKGLAVAGRVADGMLLAEGAGVPFIEWAVEQVSEAGAAASPPECVVYAWLRIDEDEGRIGRLVDPAIEHWRSSGLYPEPMRLAPADMRELGVFGDPASCARAIGRLAQAGATSVVLVPLGEDPDAQVERLGAEVVPLVRAAAGRA
jgi:alkanesulfonate monooxygenase SsuD/methylene tetrahydromethanopterin reductase-like flavin-dependent oxidoreductase (luciferase family)